MGLRAGEWDSVNAFKVHAIAARADPSRILSSAGRFDDSDAAVNIGDILGGFGIS
jgi:hypothetical protein